MDVSRAPSPGSYRSRKFSILLKPQGLSVHFAIVLVLLAFAACTPAVRGPDPSQARLDNPGVLVRTLGESSEGALFGLFLSHTGVIARLNSESGGWTIIATGVDIEHGAAFNPQNGQFAYFQDGESTIQICTEFGAKIAAVPVEGISSSGLAWVQPRKLVIGRDSSIGVVEIGKRAIAWKSLEMPPGIAASFDSLACHKGDLWFVGESENGGSSIYVIRDMLRNNVVDRVTSGPRDEWPTFVMDSLFFIRFRDGESQLVRASVSSPLSHEQVLLRTEGLLFYPSELAGRLAVRECVGVGSDGSPQQEQRITGGLRPAIRDWFATLDCASDWLFSEDLTSRDPLQLGLLDGGRVAN